MTTRHVEPRAWVLAYWFSLSTRTSSTGSAFPSRIHLMGVCVREGHWAASGRESSPDYKSTAGQCARGQNQRQTFQEAAWDIQGHAILVTLSDPGSILRFTTAPHHEEKMGRARPVWLSG